MPLIFQKTAELTLYSSPALEAGWWTSWTSPVLISWLDSLFTIAVCVSGCYFVTDLECLSFFLVFPLGIWVITLRLWNPWKNLNVWNTIARFVYEILGHVLFRDKEIWDGAQFWGEDQNKRKLLYTGGGKHLYTFWEFYYLFYQYLKYKNSSKL